MKSKPSSGYSQLSQGAKLRKRKILAEAIRPVEISPGMTVGDLLGKMSGMSIQARNLGNCARVLSRMFEDSDRPTILLGLAGPLIAAGLRNVIRGLIVGGYIAVVGSTGGS